MTPFIKKAISCVALFFSDLEHVLEKGTSITMTQPHVPAAPVGSFSQHRHSARVVLDAELTQSLWLTTANNRLAAPSPLPPTKPDVQRIEIRTEKRLPVLPAFGARAMP